MLKLGIKRYYILLVSTYFFTVLRIYVKLRFSSYQFESPNVCLTRVLQPCRFLVFYKTTPQDDGEN